MESKNVPTHADLPITAVGVHGGRMGGGRGLGSVKVRHPSAGGEL